MWRSLVAGRARAALNPCTRCPTCSFKERACSLDVCGKGDENQALQPRWTEVTTPRSWNVASFPAMPFPPQLRLHPLIREMQPLHSRLGGGGRLLGASGKRSQEPPAASTVKVRRLIAGCLRWSFRHVQAVSRRPQECPLHPGLGCPGVKASLLQPRE